MDFSYRINQDDVLEVFQTLNLMYAELSANVDNPDCIEFVEEFLKSLEVISKIATNFGLTPSEAVGYFKVKSYLDMSGGYVTIPKAEYEDLKADAECYQQLLD